MKKMIASKVYFTDFHVKTNDSLLKKIERLVKAAGIENIKMEKKFVAVKTHFGEYGNLAFIRPNYSRVIADLVKKSGGIPFLTDCNTLYVGSRKHALEHIDTAYLNGFTPMTTGCNIIIADGLKGSDDIEIPINGEYIKNAKIGRAIYDSDIIITLSHFKCHELTGFGGALKNLGMGCASRRGKMEQHSASKPTFMIDLCKGCGKCLEACGSDAISLNDKKAHLNLNKCVGCGMCISRCVFDAIFAKIDQSNEILCKKMAEYAAAAIINKPNFHISLITDVSPFCDCHSDNDVPVVEDIGILASFDPVALDMACADLVNEQPISLNSYAHLNNKKYKDVFKCAQPTTDWHVTLEHAEKMGIGTKKYKLVKVK
ncbi:MAG: DUF362 domain-containing protein [Candidatus Methanomethylophilaceae archaeon]|jgi:hypothetical protein